jgi:endonuclease YncB( thermonuclease family)
MLFDGRTSAQYRARLAELETQAKKARRGAWRFVK